MRRDKIRVFIVSTKRMMANYVFFSQKNGYNTVSEALRTGIRDWIEGTLALKNKTNEDNLLNVTKIEEIYGDKIIDWKYDTNDFEIHLEESLLQRFDKLRLQQGFKSRTKAVRAIMFHQILEWMKKYEASVNAEKTIAVNPENLKKLKQELEELKQAYGLGHELDVVWIPKIKNNKEAEVIRNKIYIYSLTYEEAEFWLEHEYHEYCQHVTSSKPLVEAMNLTLIFWKMVMEYFNNEGYKKREKYIETLLKNLKKKQATS